MTVRIEMDEMLILFVLALRVMTMSQEGYDVLVVVT